MGLSREIVVDTARLIDGADTALYYISATNGRMYIPDAHRFMRCISYHGITFIDNC